MSVDQKGRQVNNNTDNEHTFKVCAKESTTAA